MLRCYGCDSMGHVHVTVKVVKPNINAKMGVTVTKTGPSAVFVSDLKPGFIGQQSGLQNNDIILKVNGETVETPVQCTDLFKGSQELTIVVERESAVDTGRANTPQPAVQQIPTPAPKAQQAAGATAQPARSAGAAPAAANAAASTPAADSAGGLCRCMQCFQKKQ